MSTTPEGKYREHFGRQLPGGVHSSHSRDEDAGTTSCPYLIRQNDQQAVRTRDKEVKAEYWVFCCCCLFCSLSFFFLRLGVTMQFRMI